MENSLITLLSVIVGAAVSFLSTYVIELRKAKSEKYQFKRDKIISVGEDFYKFSGLALYRFETTLDNYETFLNYDTQEALDILSQTDENFQQMIAKISENQITITTADIFFGVSGVEKATKFTQELKTSHAKLEELVAKKSNRKDIMAQLEILKELLRKFIKEINDDRNTIKNRIEKILEISIEHKKL